VLIAGRLTSDLCAGYSRGMNPDAPTIRRWLSGFEAAARRDREELRRHGPRPEWAIRTALSMIEAARSDPAWRSSPNPQRDAEDEQVRRIWHTLKAARPESAA